MCKSSHAMATMLPSVQLALIFLLWISACSEAQYGDYCIADEQSTERELQYATRWACKNGADCTVIQPNHPCFYPNTTKDHASYAFNSYYQNTKRLGGSCYFIAAAILTALDPSHDTCKFEFIPGP